MNGKGNGCWGLRDYDNNSNSDSIDGEDTFAEGRQILKTHLSYERNNKVIKLANARFKQLHNGKLFCEVCGFDFIRHMGI